MKIRLTVALLTWRSFSKPPHAQGISAKPKAFVGKAQASSHNDISVLLLSILDILHLARIKVCIGEERRPPHMEARPQPTEVTKSSEDGSARSEQLAAANPTSASSDGPSAEKEASASAIDVERGEDVPTLGRRRTLAQKLRKRLTTRSSFRDGAPEVKEHNCELRVHLYPLHN